MTETAFPLLVRLSNGDRMEVTVVKGEGDVAAADGATISVANVKECIAKQDSSAPANRQRLIYKGRILEDDRMLSDYGIAKGATLFLVKSAAPATQNTSTIASGTPSTTPSGPRPIETDATPRNNIPNPMMNPFGGSMGMGQQPTAEQMQGMLNSPHMQGLLENPELLQNILQHSMQTPQMQQLMEQNPELRQVWNDPAMMQQALQMMRNPQHMQQVMRQQDLAMSQLENMPGGFAALSSMYRNVQEPMMEAAQASRQGESSSNASNTPRSSGFDGATGAAMPNPWGSPAAVSRTSATTSRNNNNAPFAGAANPWAAMAGGGAAANNPLGGAGGMPNPWGDGGMPGMVGGPHNTDQVMQMLDNPIMSQMMNDLVQNNPDMLRTMMEAQNPMLRQMFQGNPEMANNFIRQTFNPDNMRAMLQMQQAMQGGGMPDMSAMPNLFGMPPPPANYPGSGGGGELDFGNLLQQFQNTGLGVRPPPPANPAERFRNQLQQLYNMGFDDEQANLRVLQANHGNLNRAVDQLLSEPPSPMPEPAAASSGTTSTMTEEDQSSTPSTEASEPAENSTPKDYTEKKND